MTCVDIVSPLLKLHSKLNYHKCLLLAILGKECVCVCACVVEWFGGGEETVRGRSDAPTFLIVSLYFLLLKIIMNKFLNNLIVNSTISSRL